MARCSRYLSVVSLAVLAGCAQVPGQPAGDPEVGVGLRYIKDEWLAPCDGPGEAPENSVGNLLQDMADIATLGSTCRERHRSLVEYLAPLVKKSRQ